MQQSIEITVGTAIITITPKHQPDSLPPISLGMNGRFFGGAAEMQRVAETVMARGATAWTESGL
jgi:hypothetical protein